MKTKILAVVVLLTAASYVASATGTRMDITLEGPWILHPFQIPDKTGTPQWVLVAVAPKVDTFFHSPIVSAGDGYVIKQNGIFCLTFDGDCAKPEGNAFTPDTNYPDPNLINVKLPSGTTWDSNALVNIGSKNAFVIILPMPNSYSNDGLWWMEFSQAFKGSFKHSAAYNLGVQLHYTAGPANLDLRVCSVPDARQCKGGLTVDPGHHTLLKNTGTLRIVMKMPNQDEVTDDVCDYHVRDIYHLTLYLLDTASFKAKKNANQDFGYVDPARRLKDDGTGSYIGDYTDAAGTSCFDKDNQQKDDDGVLHMGMMANAPLGEQLSNLLSTLSTIQALHVLLQKAPFTQIHAEAVDLNTKSYFPKLSELDQLVLFLNTAADNVGALKTPMSSRLKSRIRKLAKDVSETKNGADCRAPIMLLGQ